MAVDILMDSGAFSVNTKGEVIDIDKYIEFLFKCGIKNLTGAISLDVIGDGEATYKNWLYMKSKGVNSIPTYHIGTDMKFLERLMKETDYIGLGGVAGVTNPRYVRENFNFLWKHYLTDKDGFPKVKVHAMGITDVSLIYDFPIFSIDSSTWLMCSRRGIILVPGLNKKELDYTQAKRIEVSTKSPHRMRRGQHIENLGEMNKKKLLAFIESKGFKLGSSEQDENGTTLDNEKGKERIIEDGLSNKYLLRDFFNVDFFLNLEKRLPAWPWSWPRKSTNYQLQLFHENVINTSEVSRNFQKQSPRIYLAGEGVDEKLMHKVVTEKGCTYRRMLSYPFRKTKALKDFEDLM